MPRVLIIKRGMDEFEKFYNLQFEKMGYSVRLLSDFDYIEQGKKDKIKRLWKLAHLNREEVSGYDLIVVFEDGGLVPFLKAKVDNSKTKIVLWQWNIKEERLAHRQAGLKKICEIWTFDPGDAAKYGWKLNNQFYPLIKYVDTYEGKVQRAFCVCTDKGRYSTLRRVRSLLQDNDVVCDFIMVQDEGKEYADIDDSWIRKEGIPYEEVLNRISLCTVVVDVVQNCQTGMTVRVLEALFYGKKLITNNVSIKNYSIYNSSNIFIVGEDDPVEFKDFLLAPIEKYSEDILDEFGIKRWIEHFLEM